MIALVCLISSCPPTNTDRLRNDYGIVKNLYQLMAYDCSDPTESGTQQHSGQAMQCPCHTSPTEKTHEISAPTEGKEKVHNGLFFLPL